MVELFDNIGADMLSIVKSAAIMTRAIDVVKSKGARHIVNSDAYSCDVRRTCMCTASSNMHVGTCCYVESTQRVDVSHQIIKIAHHGCQLLHGYVLIERI